MISSAQEVVPELTGIAVQTSISNLTVYFFTFSHFFTFLLKFSKLKAGKAEK
jgi:hypothetical protein